MNVSLPDVTPAQILAALLWIASQAVAFGWLKSMPSQVVLSGAATVIATGWKLADSHLRVGRVTALAASNAAAVHAAAATSPTLTAANPPTPQSPNHSTT